MPTAKKSPTQTFHVPGLTAKESTTVVAALQDRLFAYTDLHLVLKHVHWNVVGPNFIGVHEMLDPQVDAVRDFADVLAERIATMGGTPIGTPGALVAARSWDDYELTRDTAQAHLGALDLVYPG
jgi:starvation-inducible DNA-binding protein